MTIIKPTIEYVEPMTVVGLSMRTNNRNESNPQTAKIAVLWQHFYSSFATADMPLFGVYSDYEADADGFYTVTVGQLIVESTSKCQIIVPGNYLVFRGNGPMPTLIIDLWRQIWRYFAGKNNDQRLFATDFERYTTPEQVAIYIGVK
ncbi:Transcription activator, effector binding [Legionella beliardensis]|uniref:Transcription activator, effector binding n=1 Tax=Legionella beliardensis TaxID=91822 RepID=A0A378I014_9GAMM|nr:effector binding domain-containing protein [Legionella beliardensis]STX28509.1 Transcription activator, effector binding [Legionella beliardensis]